MRQLRVWTSKMGQTPELPSTQLNLWTQRQGLFMDSCTFLSFSDCTLLSSISCSSDKMLTAVRECTLKLFPFSVASVRSSRNNESQNTFRVMNTCLGYVLHWFMWKSFIPVHLFSLMLSSWLLCSIPSSPYSANVLPPLLLLYSSLHLLNWQRPKSKDWKSIWGKQYKIVLMSMSKQPVIAPIKFYSQDQYKVITYNDNNFGIQ